MDIVAEQIRAFVDGALGVSLEEMIIQIASTLLLFVIVRFFFWKNITDYLEKRKNAMNEEYDKAKLAKEEASSLQVQTENELKEIRISAKGIFDEAKAHGEQERQEIVSNAKVEANRIVEKAHLEVVSEIEKAKKDINDEIVSVATLMAEKIIKKEIDETRHKELIKEISKEVAN